MNRSSDWAGRLFFGTARLLYAGPVGPTAPHAHHAHQILLSREPVSVASDSDRVSTRAAFIPADAVHAIESAATEVVLLYVDPDGVEGRRLRALDIAGAASAWRDAARELANLEVEIPADWSGAERVAEAIIERAIGASDRPRVVHPAVLRALRIVAERIDEGEVRLDDVAAESGVSSSRLAHLFSREVGLPMRPYVLWLRLHRAAAAVSTDASLTEAAHAAGFADAAHFSRVFRRMFGIAPSDVLGVVEFVPPARCDRVESGSPP
jgi:AraC-like DNA-binding protein